jgi:hypothetical protein
VIVAAARRPFNAHRSRSACGLHAPRGVTVGCLEKVVGAANPPTNLTTHGRPCTSVKKRRRILPPGRPTWPQIPDLARRSAAAIDYKSYPYVMRPGRSHTRTPTTVVAPETNGRRTLKFSCFGRMRRFAISRRSTDSARWQWPATFGSYLHRLTVLASVLKLHLRRLTAAARCPVGADEMKSKRKAMIVTGLASQA